MNSEMSSSYLFLWVGYQTKAKKRKSPHELILTNSPMYVIIIIFRENFMGV